MFYTEQDLILNTNIIATTSFVKTAAECVDFYLNNLPLQYKEIIETLNNSEHIHYFAIPFLVNKMNAPTQKLFTINCSNWNEPSNTSRELTSFFSFTETDEVKTLRKEIEFQFRNVHTSCFEPLISLFGNYLKTSTASITMYKKGAYIAPHAHDWSNGALHILLDNIIDGDLKVTCGKQHKNVSKRGEWFGFDTGCVHSATMEGNSCKTIGFMLPNFKNHRYSLTVSTSSSR